MDFFLQPLQIEYHPSYPKTNLDHALRKSTTHNFDQLAILKNNLDIDQHNRVPKIQLKCKIISQYITKNGKINFNLLLSFKIVLS